MNNCSGLYLMIVLASALPAIFTSLAIVLTLLMLDKINGRDAWLLIIVIILVAFVPLAVDYIFKEKMPGNISQCLSSLISGGKQQTLKQSKLRPPSMPIPSKIQRPSMMVQQKPIQPIQPPRYPSMQMQDEEDDFLMRAFARN